ncbi:MAG: glycosyltransferase family 39 protein, partial [Clostridia bacterium]|nr:glycosyltransferase family 39 protein [Clostridia bacterium]
MAFTVIRFGIIVRVIEFGNLPCGLNQDEAYAGYEALSLANYGKDSSGYSFPCYFVSWGSGMNVLESYLAIPFVKLFGLSVVTFRLPQLICACISMPVFYLLLKEIFYEKTALAGLFVCAVSPWHIMLSRWGLESNLAPAFLLFGFYFLIKGLKKNYLLIFSAIMYGLSLYAYAITWAVVPLTIISCGIYILASRTKVSVKYLMISVCVLFLLALPLILFVFVNNGVIGEIKTPLLSVP